jgi:putative spermidine/putrescine transport system permease protein
VQGLAIFPMFVPSIILSYAFIRVLGPNGTVDLLLNAVGLPRIRSPYLTPWGPVIGLVWDHIPLTVLILLAGLGNVSNQSIEAARDVGARSWAVFWHIILPRISNSILVAISFSVLGIFSAFTLPYVLGPAAPEMMGPFMQRTFRELFDPGERHHPGRRHLRLLHRLRAVLRAVRRQEPENLMAALAHRTGASTGSASPSPSS